MTNTPTPFEQTATLLFALAILHTFAASFFRRASHRWPPGTLKANILELFGEVEVVFGIWASVLVLYLALSESGAMAIQFLEATPFTEPTFVFVVMAMAATRPLISAAREGIRLFARVIELIFRLDPESAFLFSALTLGTWMGSLITEPAAMTLVAMILKDHLFERSHSVRLKYAVIGTLFVNISIGGTLTHFAAPPVVMVAPTWGWDIAYLFTHFGWKSLISSCVSALLVILIFKKDIAKLPLKETVTEKKEHRVPLWLVAVHALFLAAAVSTSHHAAVFIPLFLLFLGITHVTREFQSPLPLRESLLVGFFLGGLVVLGGPQRWWLEPLLAQLGETSLYLGATLLTAVTDNAALTFLGAQVPNLSEGLKYSLVAGAVSGGGLTVIANAPNPAGYGILQAQFGTRGIEAHWLFLAALPATLITMICFMFL